MSTPYSGPPRSLGVGPGQNEAPNAALLIDFDNVTMGMRSDLSKELKSLLDSDIIKGKVTVQRAYADWRRYPQYIVPLSESSVDLIFAPAYGSSKKNATDIRMAIDAVELVFIRPEIGTFILLTGDSDFSSLVLKLKEYGKYVIGVGIQESSSDILVQNCDEYYSYTSITGLRKTTDGASKPKDPWKLVEEALKKMSARKDVMRSDRLKQVMIELDSGFEEKNYGFSKFSRFLGEASSRGLVDIRKLENGQHEVGVSRGAPASTSKAHPQGDRGARPEKRRASRTPRKGEADAPSGDRKAEGRDRERSPSRGEDPLQAAYSTLRDALAELAASGKESVRDSDAKRKMLELDPSFEEAELGFNKFSRFLRQAHDHEVVDMKKRDGGRYEIRLPKQAAPPETPDKRADQEARKAPDAQPTPEVAHGGAPDPQEDKGEVEAIVRRLGVRRGGRRGPPTGRDQPPILEGQVVSRSGAGNRQANADATQHVPSPGSRPSADMGGRDGASEAMVGRDPTASVMKLDLEALGLPTSPNSMVRYLVNSYKGIGEKTAETLVEKFGPGLFEVLQNEPHRLEDVLPKRRIAQILEGWSADLARRQQSGGADSTSADKKSSSRRPRRSSRRGGRDKPNDAPSE